jgi:hypothetical protein
VVRLNSLALAPKVQPISKNEIVKTFIGNFAFLK